MWDELHNLHKAVAVECQISRCAKTAFKKKKTKIKQTCLGKSDSLVDYPIPTLIALAIFDVFKTVLLIHHSAIPFKVTDNLCSSQC